MSQKEDICPSYEGVEFTKTHNGEQKLQIIKWIKLEDELPLFDEKVLVLFKPTYGGIIYKDEDLMHFGRLKKEIDKKCEGFVILGMADCRWPTNHFSAWARIEVPEGFR